MNAAIATHLNILESAIIRVEEWSKVLFVVAKGIGARFVSKKVAKVEAQKQQVTVGQFASQLVEKIKTCYTPSTGTLKASVWNKKDGETRIYIKSHKGSDCGYLMIRHSDNAVLNYGKSYVQDVTNAEIDAMLEAFEIFGSSALASDPLSTEALVARYGWAEVLDAQADVAREDWDI